MISFDRLISLTGAEVLVSLLVERFSSSAWPSRTVPCRVCAPSEQHQRTMIRKAVRTFQRDWVVGDWLRMSLAVSTLFDESSTRSWQFNIFSFILFFLSSLDSEVRTQ